MGTNGACRSADRVLHAARVAVVVLGFLTGILTRDVAAVAAVWLPLAVVVLATAWWDCRRAVPRLWLIDIAAVLVLRTVGDVDAGGEPTFALIAAPLVAGWLGGFRAVPVTMAGTAASMTIAPLAESDGSGGAVVAVVVMGALALCGAVIGDLSRRQTTARTRAEAESHRLEAVLRAMVRSDPRGVVVRNARGEIAHCNPTAEWILQLEASTDGGHEEETIFPGTVVDEEGVPIRETPLPDERARMTGQVVSEEIIGLDDGHRWIAVDAIPVDAVDGRWVVIAMRDVTEETVTRSRLQRDAAVDPLTGVGNRRLLEWTIDDMQAHGDDVVVVVVDLDDFKSVNDRFGHDVGDEVLRETAIRLSAACRPDDTVVRIGGDEFVILLRNNDEASALSVVERVQAAVEAPIPTDAGLVEVGVSLGFRGGSSTATRGLIRAADTLMYRQKSARARQSVGDRPSP